MRSLPAWIDNKISLLSEQDVLGCGGIDLKNNASVGEALDQMAALSDPQFLEVTAKSTIKAGTNCTLQSNTHYDVLLLIGNTLLCVSYVPINDKKYVFCLKTYNLVNKKSFL